MKIRLFMALSGIVALLAAAACVSVPDAPEVSKDVEQAIQDVESYRFDARYEIQATDASIQPQGTVTMQGAFVAPESFQIAVEGDDPIISGHMEMIFHSGQLYVKHSGQDWEGGGPAQLGLIVASPSLEDRWQWLEDAVSNGTAEVSRDELDRETVNHVTGTWTQEDSTPSVGVRQDGTFELWIGADDGLPRRAVYDITMTVITDPSGDRTSETRMDYSVEESYFDYNVPIEIEAPEL